MQEKKKLDVQLQAMWFAAGTAAVMACLQRAILVSFMEQWRMLVFLALNLLLLAILFTSTHNNNPTISPSSPHESAQEITSNCSRNSSLKLEFEGEKKKKKKTSDDELEDHSSITVKNGRGPNSNPRKLPQEAEAEDYPILINHEYADKLVNVGFSTKTEKVGYVAENEEQNVENVEAKELSKEELNKRAEAFITMFRQHLVSDAKAGKSGKVNPNCSVNKDGEIPKRRASFSGRRYYCREKRF